MRNERRISEWFALVTISIAWVWPFPHTRFFISVMPILLFSMIRGLYWPFEAAGFPEENRSRYIGRLRACVLAIGTLLLMVNLARDIALVKDRFTPPPYKLVRSPGMEIVTRRPAAYRSLLLLDMVRANSRVDEVVMFHSIHACGLVAERICSAVPMASPNGVMDYIDENGIDYVVADDEGGAWGASYFSYNFLLPAIERHAERFEKVAELSVGHKIGRAHV